MKTGLGTRIAYIIVSKFGSTTLGLTYSLVFAEARAALVIFRPVLSAFYRWTVGFRRLSPHAAIPVLPASAVQALMAPMIPSLAARSGGIFFPLAKVRAERAVHGPLQP